ncbi:MAG: serine hydrolase domain-containing protein [Anaerovoracaceae bacterium]
MGTAMTNKARDRALQHYLEEALYYYDLPGLQAALEMDGYYWSGAAGFRSVETREALRTDHVFHMASVAKLFTSTAVLLLAEDGRLSPEDRLVDLLPWIGIDDPRRGEIRLQNLLTHTAGIGDVDDYHWQQPRFDEEALREYCRSPEVAASHLKWSPGENKFSYSNIAYEILGCLVAEVSGMPFETFIEQRILRPLGMERTSFLTFRRPASELACPHFKDRSKHMQLLPYYPYNREHGPSSTLTSTVSDMRIWAQAHLRHRLLPARAYEKIWHAHTTVPNNGEGMGLGWFLREQNGYRLMGHEGSDDGFRSSFWLCPQRHGFIAVMANLSGAPVKRINRQLFDRFCAMEDGGAAGENGGRTDC